MITSHPIQSVKIKMNVIKVKSIIVCGLPDHHELGEGEAGSSGQLGMRISAR